jgi:hypothetical protein
VFNLQVEDQPEYFANGILVHNCVWVLTEYLDQFRKSATDAGVMTGIAPPITAGMMTEVI